MALHNELQDFKSYKLVEYQPISPDIDNYFLVHEVFEKKKSSIQYINIFCLNKKKGEKRAVSLFGQAVK